MIRRAERVPVSSVPPPARRVDGTALLLAAGLLASYVIVYPLFGLHVTIGSDSPVYVWWARVGGALGMGPLGSGARPASVGLLATLSRVTPAPAAGVLAALLPALAVATGLAAGALSDAALGADRVRFSLVAAFAGAYLSLLADGYLSTLAFVAPFVAALACMAGSLPAGGEQDPTLRHAPGRAEAFASGALILAAGLAHPLFLALAGAVVAGGVLAIVPGATRARRGGVPLALTGAVRIAAASLLGAAIVPVGLLLSGGFAASSVDTSRDEILRRTGRGSLLRSSYRRKLSHDFPWYRTLTLAVLAATPFLTRRDADRGHPPGSDRGRFLWGVSIAWVAVAGAAVLLLIVGTAAPGQRLAATCLALPLLAGMGLAGLWGVRGSGAGRRPASTDKRTRRRAAAAAGTVLFLALAWSRWLGERPLASPAVLTDARQVALALEGEPPGTPLVLIMNDTTATPTIRVVRFQNYLRDAVAPGAVGHVYVFLGTPGDYLAARPTITGQAEHDQYSRDSLATVRALSMRPLAVVVQSFDTVSFQRAQSIPGATRVASGVVVLPGTPPPVRAGSSSAVGPGPQSTWLPVWEGVLLLAIAWLAGWPLAELLLSQEAGRIRSALAPAFGFASIMLSSVLVDGVGLHLSVAGGWVVLAGAIIPGWALVLNRRGTPAPQPQP